MLNASLVSLVLCIVNMKMNICDCLVLLHPENKDKCQKVSNWSAYLTGYIANVYLFKMGFWLQKPLTDFGCLAQEIVLFLTRVNYL